MKEMKSIGVHQCLIPLSKGEGHQLFPSLYEENANKKVVASPFIGFKGLLLDHYEESDQITFFESDNAKKLGYSHLTNVFLQFLRH